MAAEDTVEPEWYAPWPNLGKKLSEQLGEIRTDTSSLSPLVRAAGLDASGDFSNLDGVADTAVQAWEIGEQDFHNRFRTHYNKTDDVFEIAYNTGTTLVPNWYTTWNIDSDGQVTQQNTPTTASNIGAGSGWFNQKTGVNLEFKSVTATSPITLTVGASSIDIDGSALVSNYSSLGGDESIITTKSGNTLPFKGLSAGPNVVLTGSGTDIEIESTAQVVEFYGIAVGHSDGSKSYIEVHNLLVNREDFYITQQTTNPSNKTVILNSISDPFNSDDYVAIIGDDMTGQLAMYDGSEAEPAITFTDDLDTGIRRRAADDMALVSGGNDIARALTDRFLTMFPLQVTNTGSEASPDIFWNPDSDTGLFQNTAGDDSIAFSTGGTRAGYFDDDQNLWVLNKVLASHVEAGTAVFYTHTYSDKFLAMRDGDLSRVAFGWLADQDTGIYRSATNTVAVATQGVNRLVLSPTLTTVAQIIQGNLGTVGAPSYSFSSDPDTGIWRKGTNQLGFATMGLQAGYFDENQDLNVTGQVKTTDGVVGAPAYTFTSDSTTGIYLNAAATDSIHFTINGVSQANFNQFGNLTLTAFALVANGSAATPSYSFTNDTDVGVYRKTTDQLGFSTAGTLAGYFDENQDLIVVTDVKAGRIEAGIGNFYTALDVDGDITQTAGDIFTTGDVNLTTDGGTLALGAGVGGDAWIWWDGTNLKVNPQAISSGQTDFTGGIVVAQNENDYSQFGPDPVSTSPSSTNDTLVSTFDKSDTSNGVHRAAFFNLEVTSDGSIGNAQLFGLNSFVNTITGTSTTSTRTTNAGAAAAGRYAFRHRGSGTIAKAGGVASQTALLQDDTGIVTDAYGYLDEGGDGGASTGELTNYHGLWITPSSGNVITKNAIRIETETNTNMTDYNGISTDLSASGGATNSQMFINHTGDAPSLHTGILTMGDQIRLPNGSEALPSVAWEDGSSNWDTGLYRAAADTIRVTSGGNDVFEWTDLSAESYVELTVPDTAYSASSWNGSSLVPTRNAVRDVIESLTVKQTDDVASFSGIKTWNFNTDSFYITQNDMTTTAAVINFRGSAGGGGETNTAANLGDDTYGLFAQKSGATLQFKSLVAGTGVSLSASATEVTINADAAAQDQLFYLTAKHSNDTASFSGLNVLVFNADSFYLTQNAPNTDEVVINLRGVVEESSSPTWTGKHIFDNIGPLIDVTATDAFLVRKNGPGTGDTFYLNVFNVDTSNRVVTVGDASPGDSVVTFYDQDALAWTVGYDDSDSEFIITSGPFGGSHNEIALAQDKVGFFNTTPASQPGPYTRTATVVESRTLNASVSATTTNNNNVLAALIADLQALGVIG